MLAEAWIARVLRDANGVGATHSFDTTDGVVDLAFLELILPSVVTLESARVVANEVQTLMRRNCGNDVSVRLREMDTLTDTHLHEHLVINLSAEISRGGDRQRALQRMAEVLSHEYGLNVSLFPHDTGSEAIYRRILRQWQNALPTNNAQVSLR